MKETKQEIIDAAISVLNADISAPLDFIAAKAGVSRRTLHRYFSSREELLGACAQDMMLTWQKAMLVAYNSTRDPIEQLEQMLYAGIDCGVKYAFLNKLRDHVDQELLQAVPDKQYEQARDKWFRRVPGLQRKGIISRALPAPWIKALFTGMITTTIEALRSGDVAPNKIKELAWHSFSKSIGIGHQQG
ncbi:TetR/AcrR family transcriptional regulator [Taibaiella koreensis]|uniref:TetR/AcrR family transcriptional regulator n=1 Tax=Taibaiella koreensis TaxID=1268548 RepID=UPI000E59A699|nr:TetR/AcrR family transcriptional regulator [Taibaiella koreensis]